jgi:hypothetical protein
LLLLHIDWVADDKRLVFGACVILAAIGVILATKFAKSYKEAMAAAGGSSSSGSELPSHGASGAATEETQELLEGE